MIKEIYREYFQKSSVFLYPILGFSKTKHPRPEKTYISWKGLFVPEDFKLICEYRRSKDPKWLKFEKEYLLTNKHLDFCEIIDDETILYVFDLGIFADDYKHFIKGRYSQISTAVKKMISDYYGTHTPEWVYIESFLFPRKYFKNYSELLGIDTKELENVKELCSLPDITKETCVHPVPDDIEIK